MEETVEEIMECIKSMTEEFSYLDQYVMYEDLQERLRTLGEEALKSEYLANEEGEEYE
jgi:hypothetical protein